MKRLSLLSVTIGLTLSILTGCSQGGGSLGNNDGNGETSMELAGGTGESETSVSKPAENGEEESLISENSENDEDWQYILDKGELVIGLDDTFAPMGFRDNGELVGFDIDFATAVCEELGVKAKFQPIEWDAKELELNGKNIDCIWNGMSITPDREESMSLTRGYLNNRIIMMTVPDIEINSKEDLKNFSVATQSKSSALELLMKDPIYAELTDIHEYPSYDEIIMDMDAGRIQVMVVDEVLGMYKNSKRENSFNISSVDFGDDLYAVGLRKTDKALTAKLQEAIDAVIASGKAAEISEKWFTTDIVIE